MTINLKMMQYQMEKVGFNKNDMASYSKVSYSVIHNLLSGKSNLEKVSLKVYSKFESLFTRTELIKAGESFTTIENYREWWFDLLLESLKESDCRIVRSGASTVVPNEKGDGNFDAYLPANTIVEWRYRDHYATMSLNIWDQQLYRDLNKKGQRDKKELVRIWAESAKREDNI